MIDREFTGLRAIVVAGFAALAVVAPAKAEDMNAPSATQVASVPEDAPDTSDVERQWEWVSGRWNIASGDMGGQIEFRVDADGTLSGYIVAANRRMTEEGYTEGMQIIRGYRPAGTDGVTWRYWAKDGQYFSAQKPGRKQDEIHGISAWKAGGVIFLPKNSDSVSIDPRLAGRMDNLIRPKGLVRPDTTALDNIIAEYNQRTAELEQNGRHEERMRLVRSAIQALESQSTTSQDAQNIAAALQLLVERQELRDNPELARAIATLEQSSDPAAEASAWQTFTAHITARAAHLAAPIAGNDYDQMTAAQMFRNVRYASTLNDDLRNAPGALSNSNISRVTSALARLQGIAALAGNPKDKTARQLMEGIRNITTTSGIKPKLTGVFEIPAAIATAMLDQTIKAVTISAGSLQEVANTIKGDRTATGRAIANSRRLNSVLSAAGYGRAVIRSVGEAVLNRIPFARTMFNWVK